jgi:hypothetical protein
VRAGYAAVALAVVLVTLIGSAAMSAGPAPPSTLAAALRLDTPGSGDSLDRRREAAIAARTADCMAALGLVYEPVPAPPPRIPDAELDPVAWSARWGFGVTTSAAWSPEPAHQDPNATYAAALPPALRDRYRAALYGDAAGPGCIAVSTDRVLGLRARVLAPLRPDLKALQRAVEADPAVRAATTTWRRCIVRATGIADPERASLGARLIEGFAARGATPGIALSTLQAEERRVATAVARCESEFSAARMRAAVPHETRFVRRHWPQLRAIGQVIRDAEEALPTVPP